MFNTELIYTRVIGSQASSRGIELKQLLSYVLSPVLTAMFSDSGEISLLRQKQFRRMGIRERGVIEMYQESNLYSCNRWFCNIMPNPWPARGATVENLQLNSEIILRSCSKAMMSILSLVDTENKVQKVLQEFHAGLS